MSKVAHQYGAVLPALKRSVNEWYIRCEMHTGRDHNKPITPWPSVVRAACQGPMSQGTRG
eukprot:CAMPEP_0174705868 /NCGR_PEP_ID=MMETSP1094-20130205/8934_1 /TAXON_ID=156173 /ORGANISM="Chrysochromulina brevifilum, Strain UTEX LB 985" /LENGTH=59 /DNA_ID=CAMNT_0015904081 /DNA_START=117 /DNA_END=296 /DNA_ORIENTATION=+